MQTMTCKRARLQDSLGTGVMECNPEEEHGKECKVW
jgi:hypothetical protein